MVLLFDHLHYSQRPEQTRPSSEREGVASKTNMHTSFASHTLSFGERVWYFTDGLFCSPKVLSPDQTLSQRVWLAKLTCMQARTDLLGLVF
jgi:hypothetical protein